MPPRLLRSQDTVRKFTLSTGMADGKMVYLDEKGAANPMLRAKVGDTIKINIHSGEGAEHDIVFPDLGASRVTSAPTAAR